MEISDSDVVGAN